MDEPRLPPDLPPDLPNDLPPDPPPGRMHADEVDTDAAQVRRLLAAQFPGWADLPIERVISAGTDNAIYRLGDDMCLRMPRIHWAVRDVEKEQQWLPILAPQLPVEVPVPLAMGRPGEGYPWKWSVYRWLEGENANVAPIADMHQAALDVAAFVRALEAIDATDGPIPAPNHRGAPLAPRELHVRKAIGEVEGMVDTDAVARAWREAVDSPEWDGPPVWVHGDLLPGNFLVRGGRITGVIDFGAIAVGDPACDLQPAWGMFSGESRDAFREAVAVDDATWARGRGWALSVGLMALPYYKDTNPVLAGIARRMITEVLADDM